VAERVRRGRSVALAVCCAALAAACSLPGNGDGADKPADGPRTTAVFTPREPVNAARLRQIAALMRQRAEGFGFQDVAVEADAGRVTVSLRGGSARELASLGKPAVLVFRPVVLLEPAGGASPARSPDPGSGSGPGSGTGAESGSEPGSAEFAALDCSVPAQRVDHQKGDARRAVACAERAEAGAWAKYLLEPVALSGTEISDAQARLDAQNGSGWQIRLAFTGSGARKFADVTARLAARLSPANQFAMVLDGAVLSAPLVSSPIPGGTAVITGNYTQDSASRLAAQLSSGSLPTAMDITSVTR
jgi:preprotein translocase subunit SecD